MRAPNAWEQFRLMRDHGGPVSNLYDLTGKRRAAAINHSYIGTLEGVVLLIVFAALLLAGVSHLKAYAIFLGATLAVTTIHMVVMLVRRETYGQLRIQEQRAGQRQSRKNLQELRSFAASLQKGKLK